MLLAADEPEFEAELVSIILLCRGGGVRGSGDLERLQPRGESKPDSDSSGNVREILSAQVVRLDDVGLKDRLLNNLVSGPIVSHRGIELEAYALANVVPVGLHLMYPLSQARKRRGSKRTWSWPVAAPLAAIAHRLRVNAGRLCAHRQAGRTNLSIVATNVAEVVEERKHPETNCVSGLSLAALAEHESMARTSWHQPKQCLLIMAVGLQIVSDDERAGESFTSMGIFNRYRRSSIGSNMREWEKEARGLTVPTKGCQTALTAESGG
ncbi:hypothetical protein AURDEDRAFT_131931 [Auricularia subglabra TFB-10046 SS5]|uniref:Uncharacterized protein n=1 Tax=Auricularia subglabra (strain TFB-10046 / SS5) TaxID=717982 RepID=J0WKX7_AURST|nr:hypothetical protein AURDEDRAFT_131931 [Auricularia subglabra TFB-10046 SS5]